MSAVRHKNMGFHSAMGVACNKNTGYTSVRSDFRHIGRVHCCDDGDIG